MVMLATVSSPPSRCSRVWAQDKIPTPKFANFSQIPLWVSLKSSSSSLKLPENQQGRIENLHLVSLSKQGRLKEALEFLKEVEMAGVSVSPRTYQCLLDSCGKLKSSYHGRAIHDLLRRAVEEENPSVFLEGCVLRMYLECGCFVDARKVFDEMPQRSLVSWVVMVSGYARGGLLNEACRLFSHMQDSGMVPNRAIYLNLLGSLVGHSCLELGKQLHCHVIRSGLGSSVEIESAIANMYVKCGWLDGAKLVFDQMAKKDVVAWTGMMVGYTRFKRQEDVLALFAEMLTEGIEPDEFVFSIVLKACASLKDLNTGKQIHGYIAKLGWESKVSVGTPLVDFYTKCANLESASHSFERISEPNDVSWSAIISGYYQSGEIEKSLKNFKSLRSEGTILNSFIFSSIFLACSALADLNMGTQAHADAIKRGLVCSLHGKTALITMYSKCGMLEYARRAFESIDKPDIVAWTAIISGYAYHGDANEALCLFRAMMNCGVRPNKVTFIAILVACTHAGLVTEGKKYLDSMKSEYGVNPTIDHYDCMIDIYSRAGLLDEALELIKTMPFEPGVTSWKSFLGGCWTHHNRQLGKIAAENLLQLDPNDTAAYVLLFNLHTSSGNWEEVSWVRKMMAERNLKKELNCSWVSVKGKIHRFKVGDREHPQSEEIYSKLKELNFSVTKDEENATLIEEDVKGQLLEHSEKLAIAFGLISTPSNAPIRVFKNFRGCKHCHDFAKHVSMITGREIVVRDTSRFHHFKSGECSCNGCW